ncbi:TonB-dependent receptor [Flagellimonas sp. S3867]|uniref:TonB-dependent receptor n=1 Tax=Flagellimonas sp. S3867 TaxID=2768063 RepID=UPI001685805F|nr:TonB-dependent receptor [Flagellimonas sp. S3867]
MKNRGIFFWGNLGLVFMLCQWSWAQTTKQNITISYENKTRKEVLLQIEEESGYEFYYDEQGLGAELISGDFRSTPVTKILTEIFKNTVINFHVLDTQTIILTSNVVIQDKLPQSFGFLDRENEKKSDSLSISSLPIEEPPPFLEEKEQQETELDIVRIGRQRRGVKQDEYKLSGIVKNANTGEPIPNLAIVVEQLSLGTVTNANGYYEIELPPGINIIQAQAIGIETSRKKIIMYNDGRLDFDLTDSAEQLDEVVVESNRIQNVENVIAGVVELDVAEIKTIPLVLGERDILKTAITLPGITNAGEGSSGYNVRGGRTDQNLFLLDKAVIYNPSHFFGIFSALNPFVTGNVTIYKGNIPSEYGGRLSSVFDIGTKEANTEKFTGEAAIGPVTSNLSVEIPIIKNKSGILIGGRTTYSNWILRSLDDEELKNSEASFFDIIAKYNDKLNENNSLEATAYLSRDAFSITSDSIYSYKNRLFAIKWNHQINEKNTLGISLSNSQYDFNIEFDGDADKNFDLGYRINETELKAKVLSVFNNSHNINYGISGKLYNVDPGYMDPLGSSSIIEPLEIQKEKGLESAVFVSDNLKVSENLSLDIGLRYSLFAALGESSQPIYDENLPKSEGTLLEVREFGANEIIKTYGGLEGRVSGRYFLLPDFSVKAGYNNTYQYIHTLSNNTTVSPTDTWKLSDLNVEPQRAEQFSLGLFKNFDESNYEVSLEGYYKKSKNLLDYKVGAQLLLNESIETEVLQGEGKAYGVEFLLKKNEGRLNGWLGYTYSRTFTKLESQFIEEQVNNGEYFPSNFDKPHDFSLVTNYKFTKRFSLSANFVYQTGRPVTFPIGTYFLDGAEFPLFSDRNKFRIPDFYRLDLSFNIEGNHKIKKFAHSFWNISIYNVLGRNNPYSVFFITENGKLQAYQSSIFSIPIPTITYNFKF